MQPQKTPTTVPATPLGVCNDDYRCNPRSIHRGELYLSSGVRALGGDFMLAAIRAAQGDTDFTEENDPHGDRDRGFMVIHGVRVWWKIDCYKRGSDFRFGSDEPTDPTQTERVMTIFLPEED
jgi:hypothetical protein